MTNKLYLSSEQEMIQFRAFQSFISDVLTDDEAMDGYKQNRIIETGEFLESISPSISTAGTLDTALISEIGKAYKEQYTLALAAENTVMENRMYGAMYAVKKIMDMVDTPNI